MDSNTIQAWPEGRHDGLDYGDVPKLQTKRAENTAHHHNGAGQAARINARQNSFILDDCAQHSARNLCESPRPAGPDFADVDEGLFCHMADKRLWPLC